MTRSTSPGRGPNVSRLSAWTTCFFGSISPGGGSCFFFAATGRFSHAKAVKPSATASFEERERGGCQNRDMDNQAGKRIPHWNYEPETTGKLLANWVTAEKLLAEVTPDAAVNDMPSARYPDDYRCYVIHLRLIIHKASRCFKYSVCNILRILGSPLCQASEHPLIAKLRAILRC